jgi:hypothetical protein
LEAKPTEVEGSLQLITKNLRIGVEGACQKNRTFPEEHRPKTKSNPDYFFEKHVRLISHSACAEMKN